MLDVNVLEFSSGPHSPHCFIPPLWKVSCAFFKEEEMDLVLLTSEYFELLVESYSKS